ncbi:hypothetical protein [Neobacillus soli]|uniref:hypothetical protein n=1 Tax=Neobacillus soli TaxID=220688 RepID=UPI000A77C32C|nr:hypothetical protein [Neobacillus soli]
MCQAPSEKLGGAGHIFVQLAKHCIGCQAYICYEDLPGGFFLIDYLVELTMFLYGNH